MLHRVRAIVLALQRLSVGIRLLCVIVSFSIIESFIVLLDTRSISSLLLIPGVFACWLFRWKVAFAQCWGLLWVHVGVLVLHHGFSSRAVSTFISGTITDIVIVGSFGALRYALDKSKHLSEMKDQFLANVNHELRTPLMGVLGSLDVLKENARHLDEEDRNLFLDQAIFSCAEMERLTGNILDAARADSDVPPPWIAEFRLDTAILDILRHVDTYGHPLYIDILEGIVVEADSQQVRQVVRNLLSNALKYAPRGTPITVTACQNGAFAQVCVEDKGPGIPPEWLPHLFQKFTHFEHDANGHVRGIGLGLYICRRFVENMGGKIWVDSTGIEGQGCAFYFTVPCSQQATKEAIEVYSDKV